VEHATGRTEGVVSELSWSRVCLTGGEQWRPEEVRLELATAPEEDLPFEEQQL
jgi:hypothetical protein